MNFLIKILGLVLVVLILVFCIATIWIKTDKGKVFIQDNISQLLQTKFVLSTQIGNIHISLPLIVDISSVSIFDKEGEVCNINNLRINLLPSFSYLREVTFWSISAAELNIIKSAVIKNTATTSSDTIFFKPTILVKEINIENIIISPQLTGLDHELIFNLFSSVKYNMNKEKWSFHGNSKITSSLQPLINQATIELRGSYDKKNELLTIKSSQIQSDAVEISSNFVVDQRNDIVSGSIKHKSNIVSAIFSGQYSEIKSESRGEIALSGTPTKPIMNAVGEISMDLPKDYHLQLLPLSYKANIVLDKKLIKANIELIQDTLKTNGIIEYKDDKLFLKKFVTQGVDFEQKIDLAVDMQNLLIDGHLSLIDKSLVELSKYLPSVHHGAIEVTANFTNKDKLQHISITGQAQDVSSDFARIKGINFALSSKDLWHDQIDELKLLIQLLRVQEFNFREVSLLGQATKNGLKLITKIKSLQPVIDLSVEAVIQQVKSGFQAVFSNFVGQINKININNTSDILFSYGDNISLVMDQLKIDQGFLDIRGNLVQKQVQAKASLHNIPPQIIPNILFSKFSSALMNGEINLHGIVTNPELITKINLTDSGSPSQGKFSINLDSKINNKRSHAVVRILDKDQKQQAIIDAQLENEFSLLPFNYAIRPNAPLMINCECNNQFDIISMLINIPGQTITGLLQGGIKITGTLQTPRVTGQLNLSKGKYDNKNSGILLKNISSTIKADNNQVHCTQIRVEDKSGNYLNGQGLINLANDLKFEFKTNTTKFQPISSPFLNGEVVGNIKLSGDKNESLIKGDCTVGPLEITIPERINYDIPQLNIVNFNDAEENTNNVKYPIKLDVSVGTNNKVFIRGWGVDARLEGKLKIQGYSYKPIITGILKSKYGKYQEFGKVLSIKEGILTFDGPIFPSPYLNITGVTNVEDTEIRLTLAGPISNPSIAIDSTPAMSEDMALSMLLFGTHPQNISTLQALQLANSARRLAGYSQGFDPIAESKKILRVDEINFNTDEQNPENSSIGVGKHFTDKIYFEIEQGRQENTTKTKIEIQITPNISIENILEQNGKTSVGVNWGFDY